MDIGTVDLIKAIADVGFMVVVSAVFIVLAVRGFTKQQKLMDKQQDWLEEFINQKIEKFKIHPDEEEIEALEVVDSEMNKELRGLLTYLRADRTYVYLYHNGGVSTSGLYFQRMSCVCEVVSQGIMPLASQEQGLYRASYSLLCDSLKENKFCRVPDVEELKGRDNFIYQQLMLHHAESSFFYALSDSINNEVVGFIGVEYCSLDKWQDNERKIKSAMQESSLRISSLVNVRDKISEKGE